MSEQNLSFFYTDSEPEGPDSDLDNSVTSVPNSHSSSLASASQKSRKRLDSISNASSDPDLYNESETEVSESEITDTDSMSDIHQEPDPKRRKQDYDTENIIESVTFESENDPEAFEDKENLQMQPIQVEDEQDIREPVPELQQMEDWSINNWMSLFGFKKNRVSSKVVVSSEQVNIARNCVLERLTGVSLPFQIYAPLDHQTEALFKLAYRTVQYAESNTVLLVGPHGSGKSTVVRWVLTEIIENHKATSDMKPFFTVNLNGAVHMNEMMAMKSIAEQLQLESQPDDILRSGSSAEYLLYILETVRQGNERTVPIVFVLENFDGFVTNAGHSSQRLLYNLFDLAQSQGNPIVVIGITCRVDTVDLLEKRVKSRFSNRQLLIHPPNRDNFVGAVISNLSLNEADAEKIGNGEYVEAFNQKLECLTSERSFISMIDWVYEYNNSVGNALGLFIRPVSALSEESPLYTKSSFDAISKSLSFDYTIERLKTLSILELSLVLAMRNLIVMQDCHIFNFPILYDEYESSLQRFETTSKGSTTASFGGGKVVVVGAAVRGLYFSKAVAMK
ncbi:origin recognition complex subunit 4, partial [Nowakowskiella sp. JEL0407]